MTRSILVILLLITAAGHPIARASSPTAPAPGASTYSTDTEVPTDEEALGTYWFRVDTRSPRSTLQSLRRVMRGYLRTVQSDEGYTWDDLTMVRNVERQMPRIFDLQGVPSDFRRFMGMETAVMVREILARVNLPPENEIPDEDEMAARVGAGKLAIYRVPGTTIEIGLTLEGPHTGRYQFRPETVAQARLLYEQVKDAPYVERQQHVDGLYKHYFLLPGPLIPDEWVAALPGGLTAEFSEQTIWQWLVLFASLAAYFYLLRRYHLLMVELSERRSELFHRLALLTNPAFGILLTMLMEHFWRDQLFLSGIVLQGMLFLTRLVYLFYCVTAVIAIGNAIAEAAAKSERLVNSQLDQQLVRLVTRILSTAVAVVVIIEGMQRIGFSPATLVAGAGVGGLAIALAAQNTFKNIIAGIELTLDRPFAVSQLVEVAGYRGTVEEIGLRSTRLRTLMGHQVTIPNEKLAGSNVENIGRRPFIRRFFDVTVTYDTSPDKVGEAVEILRNILSLDAPWGEGDSLQFEGVSNEGHPNEHINCDPDRLPRAYFNNLNSYSLNIYVSYWFHPAQYWDFMKHSHWINTQIMERFNAAGIDFAFPTQTLHLAGDDKRPLVVGLRAGDAIAND